jgi:hypothetical protein
LNKTTSGGRLDLPVFGHANIYDDHVLNFNINIATSIYTDDLSVIRENIRDRLLSTLSECEENEGLGTNDRQKTSSGQTVHPVEDCEVMTKLDINR